jgi:hypothetical protein
LLVASESEWRYRIRLGVNPFLSGTLGKMYIPRSIGSMVARPVLSESVDWVGLDLFRWLVCIHGCVLV